MSGQDTAVNVLVVFYSRHGATEQAALAAGVGALQARANIRLRRLVDAASETTIAADPSWAENVQRMRRDYVPPRPADPVWADAIVLAAPAGAVTEVKAFLASLTSDQSLEDKLLAPIFPEGSGEMLSPLYTAAVSSALLLVPTQPDPADAIAGARHHGRRVSHMARALKALAGSHP